MTIITVTGYKGGIGKSTTAFHLAAYFSDLGKTVLIDGDPNRTALKWSGRSEDALPFTVADERQAMKIIPGMEYVIIDTPARRRRARARPSRMRGGRSPILLSRARASRRSV